MLKLTRLLLPTLLLTAACQSGPDHTISPSARIATQSVPVNQVEDAAIWVHPTDPTKSILFVANTTRGVGIHDFEGYLLKHYDDGKPLAGIDVLYNFPLNGKPVDLLLAACPATTPADAGVRIWQIDPAKQRITEVTEKNAIPVLDGTEPLGIATYHSRKTNNNFFFVTTEEGKVEQYQLATTPDAHITAKRVRSMQFPSKVKGVVADEETGLLYAAPEKHGVYELGAEPDAPTTGHCIIPLGQNGLNGDLPGITLFSAHNGKGYLIVVCQAPKGKPSALFLYDRQAPHKYVLTITPSLAPPGDIYSSSGIAVTNQPTTTQFPLGVLAAKNRINPSGVEDYKLYSWQDLARSAGLITDPTWSPRGHE